MAEELRATTENVRETWAWIDNYPYEGEHSDWLAKDFDRWLASEKAKAWDEGHEAGQANVWSGADPLIENPYA